MSSTTNSETSAGNAPSGTNTLHPNTRQCAFLKTNGVRCGAPAKGENDLCHSHLDHKERLYPQHIVLPPLEDAHAIQVATLDIMNALLYGRIEKPVASGLLYGLQLAQTNLKNLAPAAKPVEPRSSGRPGKESASELEEKFPDDYDENGEPASLAAILFRELDLELKKPGHADRAGDSPLERE